MRLHKTISAVLGILSAGAGIVAFLGYTFPATQDLLPPPVGTVIYGRASFSDRLLGALILWGLTTAAFYMAFRLLRFVFVARKS